MMRRAPNANATQEVRVEDVLSSTEARSAGQTQEVRGVDILEEFPIDVPPMRARPAVRPNSRVRADSRDETPSIAPFEIDIEMPDMKWPTMDARRAESTFDIEAPAPPRRLRMVVAGAMVFSGLILGGAALRTVVTASESSDAPRAATQVFVRMAPATVTHAAAATIAHQDVSGATIPSAPLAGTIALGPRPQALTIDGTRMTPSTSVIVPCGQHLVRVGKDKAQTIDVPCGGTIAVKRLGKTGR